MKIIPPYVIVVFIISTIYSLYCLFRGAKGSRKVLYISLGWLLLQAFISSTGFYRETSAFPPRFTLLPLPPLLLIIFLFSTTRGRIFLDNLDQKWLTLLHVVRIPVEVVLFWLFVAGAVPRIMTFEGRNFDVISGASALLVYYFVFIQQKKNRSLLIAWNVICLLLLFNVVITAILSVPTPFQRLGFEQPNVGILFFPFVWLPAFVVPAVLLAHLVSLRKLISTRNEAAANLFAR